MRDLASSILGSHALSTSYFTPASCGARGRCFRRAVLAHITSEGACGCQRAAQEKRQLVQASKRTVLLCLLAAPHARALESTVQRVLDASPPESSQPGGTLYQTNDFSLRVPQDFQIVLDPVYPVEKLGRGQAPPTTPLKAKFISPDRSEVLTVVVRESSKVKPTFLQLSDISQWGSPADAGRLLIPAGCTLLSTDSKQIELPARDTGSFMGFVKPPPQNIYRYEFATANGLHISLAVAARAGQLYMAGASTSSARWGAAAPRLRPAVDSFRLITPTPL